MVVRTNLISSCCLIFLLIYLLKEVLKENYCNFIKILEINSKETIRVNKIFKVKEKDFLKFKLY